MMKLNWFLIALSLCYGFSAFAEGQGIEIREEPSRRAAPSEEGDKTLASGGSFGAVNFDNLVSNGILKLTGTSVKQALQVSGSLLTQAANLNTVEVLGEANLKNTVITQAMKVIGFLRAEKSVFKGPLTIGGFKATFIGSQVASLKILPESNCKGHQIIELRQKTTVDGPIVFDSGKGEVHCYPGCYVLGTISGGKLIKKN